MNKSLIKYITALLLFGSNGIVAGLINMSSYEIVMFRTMIGSIFLIIIYIHFNKHFTFYNHKNSFIFLCLSGLSMGISWLFLYEAYEQIGVSIASLGYYCGPIIVMVLSPIIFKEKLTQKKLICFLITFIGIILVNGNTALKTHAGFGIFCALMSAVMYACMVISNKKAKKISGLENATLQLFIAFLCVFIFTIFKQGLHFEINGSDILPILFIGIVNTGLGCFLYFSSIGNLKVQTVAVLGYLEPLSAVVLSVIILKEQLFLLQIIGAVLIVSGAVIEPFLSDV